MTDMGCKKCQFYEALQISGKFLWWKSSETIEVCRRFGVNGYRCQDARASMRLSTGGCAILAAGPCGPEGLYWTAKGA